MKADKKILIVLVAVSLVVTATVLIYDRLFPAGVPGSLYRYYPVSSGFYMELAPGEKMTRRFLTLLEQQNAGSNVALQDPLEVRRQNFRKAFLQKYGSTFKPYFSLGIWPDAKPGQSSIQADQTGFYGANTLVVLPLRKPMNLPTLAKRFELPLNDFTRKRFGKTSYMIDQDSGNVLAILDEKLLIANSETAMRNALDHRLRKLPNVYDNPVNREYLAKLPSGRQGAFILNNMVYQKGQLKNRFSPQQRSLASGLQDIVPILAGAIRAGQNNVISIPFVTPIFLKEMPPELKQNLQAMYAKPESFNQAGLLPADTVMMLGVASMDKVYDFYNATMMPMETRRMLQVADLYLDSFQLDMRRDLISLFDKRTVIASRKTQPSLMVIADKNPLKDKTLNKISSLLSTNAFPVKQETLQIGETSLKTLSVSETVPNRRPERISYGTVGDFLAFAPPEDFLVIARLYQNKKQQDLTELPLYRDLTRGLPSKNNLLLFTDLKARRPEALQAEWVEALALALQVKPDRKDEADLVYGQLNLKMSQLPTSR